MENRPVVSFPSKQFSYSTSTQSFYMPSFSLSSFYYYFFFSWNFGVLFDFQVRTWRGQPTDYSLQPTEKDWVAVDDPAHFLHLLAWRIR